MTYGVEFHPEALDEFDSLQKSIREILVKKLLKRMVDPFVLSARLGGDLHDCFKIKDKKVEFAWSIRLMFSLAPFS